MSAVRPLRVLLVSMECMPFAQAGGLGEVVAELARALVRAGHDARVAMPWYPSIDSDALRVREIGQLAVRFAGRREPVAIGTSDALGAPVYLLRHRRYTARLYRGRADRLGWVDEPVRHRFFSLAAAAFVDASAWRPDVIQINDHHTSLVPSFLREPRPAIVLAIHNAYFQGGFYHRSLVPPALRDRDAKPLPAESSPRARFVSFLRRGVRSADLVVAVSETYARELQAKDSPDGLADILAGKPVIGIVNGIDTQRFDPARDRSIPARYTAASLARRARNKRELQRRVGLPAAAGVPLVAFVARLSKQKGLEHVFASLAELAELGIQLAICGDGDFLAREVRALARAAPSFVSYRPFDRELEPLYYAGADMLLAPSHYEPCGLVQLKALRYGAVPIVHRVGGLADTVCEAARGGTGFTYEADTAEAMVAAIERALAAFAMPARWRALQRTGMALDHGWPAAAVRYVAAYRRAIRNAAR